MLDTRKLLGGRFTHNATFITYSYGYAENYDKIKVRSLDINTKGELPDVV